MIRGKMGIVKKRISEAFLVGIFFGNTGIAEYENEGATANKYSQPILKPGDLNGVSDTF